ncbi:MAG: beta-galactosidase [Ruminococcaceae bacterium]|nr:beta-galactosidase [Oscillospiraceae bacterium]
MNNIPRCEHPRPDRLREQWMNLNGVWDFEIDNDKVGLEAKFYERDSLDQKINVPFSPETVLSGIGHTDFMNAVWYRRNIDIPAEWAGKRVILHIDACDHTTRVFVNGKSVGAPHKGGYTSFAYDITDALGEKDNYITIYAEDDILSGKQFAGKQSTKLNSYGCFYTRTTGIWQTVWLEAVEVAHVLSYKVYPNISGPSVVIETATVGTQSDDTLCVKAYYEGKLMGSATTKMASATTVMEIELAEAHLWECGNGRLYDLVFELTSGEAVDVMNGYFGLREVKLTKENGLQINGKTVFGRFVLDQGFNPEGVITAPSDEALKFDIEASMACGFNGARLHQKVFEPRFLYHADKLGYMVWAEAGNWGMDHTDFTNLENCLPEWLEEMERDFSHPSVIGWCPFNETWDRDGRSQSIALIDSIYDITKAIDPTRPVVATSGSFPTTRTDVHDVHDYEQDPALFRSYYAEMDKGIARDQLWRMKPELQVYKTELPVFMSEYGGIRWVMDDDNAGWGYGASVLSEDEFFTRLEGLTDAILENPHFFAFCYTQLTDVEQEQNGLLTYDRRFKFPVEKYARIFSKKSVIEK